MKPLNSILKDARIQSGYSLANAGHAIDVSDSTIQRCESGQLDWKVDHIFKLLHLYNFNPLVALEEAGYISSEEIKSAEKRVQFNEKSSASSDTSFRLGELFCGPGGLAEGAMNASAGDGSEWQIVHAWATDYDQDTCRTYTHNICPDNPDSVVCEDIRKLNLASLHSISDIDALAFGFPCNDFSVVGEQKGINGTYGPLYTYGVQALKEFQPKWFLAENVGGLKTANDGKVFKKILQDLQDAGYRITPHLYKFEEYGVPQARHRIIIVGIRNDLTDVEYKVPSPEPYSHINNSAKWALENPPIPESASNNERTRQDPRVVERLSYIKPGQNAFTADLPDHLQLKVKGAKISQIYKRLDPDKPSYTVTGSGGGGTHMYHWSEPRALTNRERARLQTFPDTFRFSGSKESVRKQIGMAVPCSGAKVIFDAVLKSFAGIEYPSIEPNLDLDK